LFCRGPGGGNPANYRVSSSRLNALKMNSQPRMETRDPGFRVLFEEPHKSQIPTGQSEQGCDKVEVAT